MFTTEAPRKVRVTASTGGLFTKGNHFSGNTGRTTPVHENFVPRSSTYYGVNSTLGSAPYLGPKKKAKPDAKRGRVCPGCGLETPLSGKCNECWD